MVTSTHIHVDTVSQSNIYTWEHTHTYTHTHTNLHTHKLTHTFISIYSFIYIIKQNERRRETQT